MLSSSNLHFDNYLSDFKFKPDFHANILLIPVVISTILIVLQGISIAAATGFSMPCMAKYRPITLYIMETKKLKPITVTED